MYSIAYDDKFIKVLPQRSRNSKQPCFIPLVEDEQLQIGQDKPVPIGPITVLCDPALPWCCVFGHRTLDLVRCSQGELGIDFKRDGERRVWVGCQEADDLLRNLNEVHLGGGWLDLDGTVKRLRF